MRMRKTKIKRLSEIQSRDYSYARPTDQALLRVFLAWLKRECQKDKPR